MKTGYKIIWLFAILMGLSACTAEKKQERIALASMTWEEVTEKAQDKEVNMMMWQGDPLINTYMKDFVKPKLKSLYGIELNISSGQGKDLVGHVLGELEAGKTDGEIDMVWINGETFFQLRELNALFGKFTDLLPNNQYVDWENPFVSQDFQQPVDGMECPWGNVQLAFIYDENRTETVPVSFSEIAQYVKDNPGQFTIPNEFTGMTLLKSWMIALAGEQELEGAFNEVKYNQYSQQLFEKINQLKPYFWKEGRTFPATLAQQHQLFANGEITFTFSNNDTEVDNKILQGLFAATAKAYVPAPGTIQNSHYLSILHNAQHPEAALMVINFLISPEAQFEKAKPAVWGDGTVLDIEKLPAEWKERFAHIPERKNAPNRQAIQDKAFQELAPEYMIRLYEDFRKEVIEK
ncbi:ABC transporter substrate-binding protein [Limibacter armeniacum]|uniref:ABC transporter substrate-binding protein n=1 Tax=Limibacter armeniacum TaxID=466084 RepID=UPI002FE62A45